MQLRASGVCVGLDDPLGPDVVGAKAASLGRARRLGLPVLPGLVIVADASRTSLAGAAASLEAGGSGAARLAIMEAPLDERFDEARRRAAALAASLVVRSSSPLEAEGEWAGAFASYIGIGADQLDTAIRGVWASAFTRDVIERCELQGIELAALRLAVLIQPAIEFEAGGSARIDADGVVRITATSGSPAALMTGWVAGEEIVVDPKGSVPEQGTRVSAQAVIDVAGLARSVAAVMNDDLIEWGWSRSFGVLLLQSRKMRAPSAGAHLAIATRPNDTPEALAAIQLARLVRRFPGWLAEELVWPWAIRCAEIEAEARVLPHISGAEALEEARELGRRLAAVAWNLPPEKALGAAIKAIEALRTTSASDVLLEQLQTTVSLDPTLVQRLVALLRVAEAPGVPQRDRWEPFLYTTIAAYGERRHATPVIGGVGAGAARFSDVPAAAKPEFDRKILIVPRPLAAFAPLLWNAAGLVSVAGGTGAHLIEIARSLGVPTVMRCALDDLIARGAENFLLAVDGDAGVVSALSAWR